MFESLAMTYPVLPYTPFQPPFVVVSVDKNVADGPPALELLLTVTVAGADVVDWFNVSVAMAVNVCEAFVTLVVSQLIEYGPEPVIGAPRLDQSTWNCTEDIPAAAVALAVTVTVPDTVPTRRARDAYRGWWRRRTCCRGGVEEQASDHRVEPRVVRHLDDYAALDVPGGVNPSVKAG